MVVISESEREGFEDVLGSGGIFRKMLALNKDGIQAGNAPVQVPSSSALARLRYAQLSTLIDTC
jgi:hypothetical protein